jgi:hypothetical protein
MRCTTRAVARLALPRPTAHARSLPSRGPSPRAAPALVVVASPTRSPLLAARAASAMAPAPLTTAADNPLLEVREKEGGGGEERVRV